MRASEIGLLAPPSRGRGLKGVCTSQVWRRCCATWSCILSGGWSFCTPRCLCVKSVATTDPSSSRRSPKCKPRLLLRHCLAAGTIKLELNGFCRSCPPVAVVLARKRMAGERVERCDQVEFDVVEVADIMGWQLPLVKRGLRQLQWSTDRGGCS